MSRPLILALHGVGSCSSDMAAALAPLTSIAQVIALDGCEPFDGGGRRRQWFSVNGVTEADRPRRVEEALPGLIKRIEDVARDHHVPRGELVLLGFSQGAIMTLAMVAHGHHAGRAIAISGRLASSVVQAGAKPASLLVIGDSADQVMPSCLSAQAAEKLTGAGHRASTILTDGIGHGIGPQTISEISAWLASEPCLETSTLDLEGPHDD
ncbi:phospholipase/Carboxylesterase family protein (plasmid) [Blastomonas sp. RAC04]|uniref:alpha/beta hydrolase n=1 Tax=Blastomonas sp. RAC04 TaxID=1842535 RepID=UPI0008561C08|nr:esterase [Blastomonas sp. RAC04]AOF98780.1 phospholipase/Carboxylesterase family protein [Blastomonas sp. RAC04]